MQDRQLTLGETAQRTTTLDRAREEEIARLVELFYERTRADAVLGPIFASHVADWDAHLAKMNDFWTSAVYRTGRYSGRPFEAHRPFTELTPAHFARWFALWERTVRDVVRTDAEGPLLLLAGRMAESISARMGVPFTLPDAG